jgi:hypothetical protein
LQFAVDGSQLGIFAVKRVKVSAEG